MAKPDKAHTWTDKELASLEKRIASVYKDAASDLDKTISDYFAGFAKRDAEMKDRLDAGEIDENYYRQWRLNQMGRGERFQAMRDKVAQRATDANAVARSYVQDATPGIYSLNRNYTAYEIDKMTGQLHADWTLFDEQTVKRLVKDEPDVMPYYSPTKALERGIDLKYGKSQITKSVTSSIIQGKSIKGIADDLQGRITTMSRDSAIRTARTAVTAAQNAGRMDSYAAAEKMGIELEREWVSTLDNRTRHEHQILDGQKRPLDEPFEVGGDTIMYPGDPSAPGYLIYNCRCTLIAAVKGVDTSDAKRRARDPETGEREVVSDMTYNEWMAAKRGETVQENKAQVIDTELSKMLDSAKIKYNPVESLQSPFSEEKAISDVGGGDLTSGSCVSAALAYAGNENGLNVRDFRGGASQDFFSHNKNIIEIANFPGVSSVIKTDKNAIKAATECIKTVENGKTYILSVGQHGAIIRKSPTGKGYEYLELQTQKENGYHKLTTDALKDRFGCKKSRSTYGISIEQKAVMIDVQSLDGSGEFRKILGYINTPENEQMKGVGGRAK